MTTTILSYSTYTISCSHGLTAEFLGDAYGAVYTDRDLAELECEYLEDAASDPEDACHGATYSVEEAEHSIECDFGSLTVEDDGPEIDGLGVAWRYVSLTVRHSGPRHHGEWGVWCVVGVPPQYHVTAEAAGHSRGVIEAWSVDESDFDDVPEEHREIVDDFVIGHAAEMWAAANE